MDNTCKKAFFCMTPDMFPEDVTNPELFEGCELECEDDEILIADTRYGGHWYCLKKIGPMPMLCPGGFNTGNIIDCEKGSVSFPVRMWMFWNRC